MNKYEGKFFKTSSGVAWVRKEQNIVEDFVLGEIIVIGKDRIREFDFLDFEHPVATYADFEAAGSALIEKIDNLLDEAEPRPENDIVEEILNSSYEQLDFRDTPPRVVCYHECGAAVTFDLSVEDTKRLQDRLVGEAILDGNLP